MTVPSYTTDLTTINDGESGTWVEMTGWANGGTPQVNTTEWYIQGSGCCTASMNNKTTIQSIAFNNGSDISGSFSTNDCVFMWQVCLAGGVLQTWTNGGLRLIIGSGQGDFNAWITGGSDYAPNPYGGWKNAAVDPTYTPVDYTVGTPTSAYQYFGSGLIAAGAVSKGEMHCVDVIRYGRGELIIEYGETGSYGTFTGLATKNDANDATNGYNRWGLFQAISGGFLWKGLMSLGNATNACDFRDTNANIFIDDTPRTFAAFNRIEINNASSRVDWTNVNFIALNESGLSVGQFEAIDNATINFTTCVFTGMSTFVFQSNSVLSGCSWLRCGQVTQGGADIDDCTFDNSDAAVTLLVSNLNNVDNCHFESDGSNHAMELTSAHAGSSYTLTGCTYNGYAATDGSTGNECIYNNSGGAVTITIDGGDTPSIRNGSGASTTVVSGAVTVKVTVKNAIGTVIENARVLVQASDGTGPFPYNETVTIVNSGTTATVTHTGHGMATNDKVVIYGASHEENNGVFTITITDVDTYTYTMSSAPGSSPTGTIKSTFVALYGLTDVNGAISTSRVYSSDQPVLGWARKSTISPLYKQGPISETIDSVDGVSTTAILIADE